MANFKIIKDLAKRKNISLKKLSEIIGLTEQGLQSIMKNNQTNTSTLEKLCDVLDVSAGVFFENKKLTKDIANNHVLFGNKIGNNNFNSTTIDENAIENSKYFIDIIKKIQTQIDTRDEQIGILIKTNQKLADKLLS